MSRRSHVVDALERRVLMAANPIGPEFLANTAVEAGGNSVAAVAADADGDFVVAWQTYGQDGSGAGIAVRRYNAGGVAQGDQTQVNTFTAGAQNAAAVAVDGDGDFVVAWQSANQDGAGYGIYAQRFDAAGNKLGGEFRANSTTAGNETAPAVAMDVAGNFAIVWQASPDLNTFNAERDVLAQRYAVDGTPVGVEFRVSSDSGGVQLFPSAAMDADGDLVVGWQVGGSLLARRFNAAGAPLTGDLTVDSSGTAVGGGARITADADGDFAVAWRYGDLLGSDVQARRFNAAGVAQGPAFPVNVGTDGLQGAPAVAMDADGDLTVTWSSRTGSFSAAFSYGIYTRQFNAAGVAQTAGDVQVHTTTEGSRNQPAIAADADGDLVIAWHGSGAGGNGVVGRRLDEPTDTAGPVVTDVWLDGGERAAAGTTLGRGMSSLVVGFSEILSTAGGTTGANSATNPANYRLTRNGVDVSSQITSVAFALNASTRKYEATLAFPGRLGAGAYVVTARANLRDPAGNTLDGNLDGAPGGPDVTRAFTLDPVVRTGPQMPVNVSTGGNQRAPDVAAEANGDFVVVWQGPDGVGGVYARRYNAAGVPQGGEITVHTNATAANNASPAVAMDADGDFVVVWGSTTGPAGQRFNAAGVKQGGEFRVDNGFGGGTPDVAMDDDGDFVVVWESYGQDPSNGFIFPGGWGIRAQRFNAAGVKQGFDVPANAQPYYDQLRPSVAMDADGDFVVAWDETSSFVLPGTIVQRFNAAGARQGGEMFVAAGGVTHPQVAMDAAGRFAVARLSSLTGTTDVHVRRYDGNGAPLGGDTPVNAGGGVQLFPPALAMSDAGSFVVAWTSSGHDGDGNGVFAQRFSPTGLAWDDRVLLNNTTTAGTQHMPAVTMDADGDFVAAWESNASGSNADIHAQRFQRDRAPVAFGIPAVNVQQDEADTVISLWDAFDDYNDADNLLTFSVASNTNPALFTATAVNNAAGTLTLDYAPGRSGTATVTVRATDRGGLFVDTSFAVNVISALPAWLGAGSVATWNAATKALTVTGAASIVADPGTDAPVVTAGGAAAVLTINTPSGGQVNLGGLQLSSSARASVSPLGAARTLIVAGGANLTLDATATLDLTDNALVVRNASESAALAKHTSVNNLVRNAFHDFAWDQPGITSSTAQADVAGGTPSTLGILLNNDGGGGPLFYGNGADLPTFMGANVDGNTVMVRFTRLGDGDVNGGVDSVDFALFQAGYTGAAPYMGFAFGDYDYNGAVDSVDFGLFQAGYQTAVGSISAHEDEEDSLTAVGNPLGI